MSGMNRATLRKVRAAAAKGAARDAGTFLSLDPRNEDWRRFCADLAARPPDGPHADRVVADTSLPTVQAPAPVQPGLI